MKKTTFLLLCIFITSFSFSQETTPPETIIDFQAEHHILYTLNGYDESYFQLNWTIPYDDSQITNYKVYNYDQLFREFYCDGCNNYTLNSLQENTDYCLKIVAVDEYENEASMSNEICLDTNRYYTSELIISQYYEGVNNNKAIELSVNPNNFNETINLSEYDLRINIDGGSSWSVPLTLSGNFSQDSNYLNSYVIINSAATNPDLINNADLSTNNQVLQFDGNDPIGLFRNGELVDVIGHFNGGNNYFAQNINLYRDQCIVFEPSTTSSVTFIEDEWSDNPFCIDYVYEELIGIYSLCCLLSTKDKTINSFKITPNPITSSELKITNTNHIDVETILLFDINGKYINTFEVNYTSNKFLIQLPQLNKGIYFIKINSGNKSVTKKLIKQ